MPLDGITTHFLAKELNDSLTGARVEKIAQPDKFLISIKLRNHNLSFFLKICVNPSEPYITISEDQSENPSVPPRFCTLLRKHLSGGRITSVKADDFERMTRFEFRCVNDMGDVVNLSLISEIMGKYSNMILINDNSVIIDSLIHVDSYTSRLREILPAHPYLLPPSQDKILPDEAALKIREPSFWKDTEDMYPDKIIISKITGFSPLIAKEIVYRANIDPRCRFRSLDDVAIERFYNVLGNVLSDISQNKIIPTIIFEDKDKRIPKDYHALPISFMPFSQAYPDVLTAVEEFYDLRETVRKIDSRKNDLIRILKKKIESLENLSAIHRKEIDESKDFEDSKIFGDLIYANMYKLSGGENFIDAENFISGKSSLIRIPLDVNLSPSRNAQKYYKIFKKMKSRNEIAGNFLKKELSSLDYLFSVLISVMNAEDENDLDAIEAEFDIVPLLRDTVKSGYYQKEKSNKSNKHTGKGSSGSSPRRYVSTDGFEILIGRNNIQNDELTFRIASKNDIWMHIHLAPGTHTIVRTDGKEIPASTLEQAAMLTAWFSRKEAGRDSKATVDHCYAKYVTKQKHSEPGRVFYRNFGSLTVYPGIPPLSERK